MAVFVAASDEAEAGNQQGPFVYGGYVAPIDYWDKVFAPAWEERVLNTAPVIDHFHTTEMQSKHWQASNGITATQSYWKVEEAVRVVSGSGQLHPVRGLMNGGHFRDAFRGFKYVRYEPQPGFYKAHHPDFIGFQAFVQGVLEYVAEQHPTAEKVDFVVERKTGVTHYLSDHIDSIKEALAARGFENLVRYIGDVIPAGKERVPLQAADVMLWHVRRFEAGEDDRVDRRRLHMLLDGRWQSVNSLHPGPVQEIADKVRGLVAPNPFDRPKVKAGGGEGAS